MPSRRPATQLWMTPTVLDYVGAEVLMLAPTLGPRLEEFLFDPVADAAVERTMTELVRRGVGWDAFSRAEAVALVARIDAYVIPPMDERLWIGKKIATCTKLIEVIWEWMYFAMKELEAATPEEIGELTDLAAYGTETAVHVLVAGAKMVGDESPGVKRIVKWLPVRERGPAVH